MQYSRLGQCSVGRSQSSSVRDKKAAYQARARVETVADHDGALVGGCSRGEVHPSPTDKNGAQSLLHREQGESDGQPCLLGVSERALHDQQMLLEQQRLESGEPGMGGGRSVIRPLLARFLSAFWCELIRPPVTQHRSCDFHPRSIDAPYNRPPHPAKLDHYCQAPFFVAPIVQVSLPS